MATACLTVALVARDEAEGTQLAAALSADEIDVRWQAADPDSLLDTIHETAPDALVVTVTTAAERQWVRPLRAALPETPVLAVTGADSQRELRDLLGDGADGIVTKASFETSLGPAVRAVCTGQLALPGAFRSSFARPLLSPREKQILAMVVMGFTNQEIANKLFVVESTVKSHLSSVFHKLGVRSRSEAAALVLDADAGLGQGILGISEGEPLLGPELDLRAAEGERSGVGAAY
ncbi:MAG TPA: response regulator transcription factor [Gaiellaceae bacterium]